MTRGDLIALLPLIVLAATAVAIMLVAAWYRSHRLTAALTLTGLAAAFVLLVAVSRLAPRPITPLLLIDGYALFYMGLIFAASFAVVLLAYGYWAAHPGSLTEFYLLVLLATLGSSVIVAASHFASFFLGLEILSVSLYALIAYRTMAAQGIEAGLKYLVLAAVSAALLLFGMALIYMELGTMEFGRLASLLAVHPPYRPMVLIGLVMILVGIAFKLGLVPFHLWTPDVYQGAPAPITAFIATISKGAMFALLLRYFAAVRVDQTPSLVLVFVLIAIVSMVAGNLLALLQNNIKRLLAYSSIAHLGYLLVAFLASGPRGAAAATYYLAAYFVTMLGAFGVVTILSVRDGDADRLEDYAGLGHRRPWVAGVFAGTLLSLAGIPLTAGFIGKFYIITAGVGSHLWLLVVVLVTTSTIGLFYYLRIVTVMYQLPSEIPTGLPPEPTSRAASYSLTGAVALSSLAFALIWLGVYPGPLLRIIHAAVADLH